ncbi:hypothetical protein GC173_00095 [bacterium]|nr:hypothetical protein [bacterium]
MNTLFGKLKASRQGSVLVLVLVTSLLLSAVILFSIRSAQDDTQAAYRTMFLLQGRYLTEGATERAKGDLLCQIAATNFLGGNFNTVGTLYSNINNRFNVADKRIPTNMESADIDWTAPSIVARARWDFSSDATLDIPGTNDWGFGTDDTGESIGIVRTYITRSIIDEHGDVYNNTVGSYETTLTSWAQTGTATLPVTSLTSKSFSHGLVFPRLFDFLYLGNSLNDCSMCHLKIMGDIGQVNAADPFEMHISYNAARFNRLTLYGSIYTNGNFIRRAQGEWQGDNRQERMMYAPGQDNDYSKPEGGLKPKMLIFAKNGGDLISQFNSESNPYPNPFRTIETLATPLPATWPSVKANLLDWFEPRAITSAASNSAKLNMDQWDNNIGYVVASGTTNSAALPWLRPITIGRPKIDDNFATTPQTIWHPYNVRNGTAEWRFDATVSSNITPTDTYNTAMAPFRYLPFLRSRDISTAADSRVPYGYQDIWTETTASPFTTVSARVTPGDGIPDLDLDENGTVDANDDALRIHPFAIDRAPNRYNAGPSSNRANVNTNGNLIVNKGLHPIDDFDYDTIPNGFDPDMDGDGIPESPRASQDNTLLGYYVTTQEAVDNGWVVWVDPSGRESSDTGYSSLNNRPQWKLGMQKIRFASHAAPYDPLPSATAPTIYWVRMGALDFIRMSHNNIPARPGSGTNRTNYDNARNQSNSHATTAEIVNSILTSPPASQYFTNTDVTVWQPNTTTQWNPTPQDVWTNGGAAKCYPVINRDRTDSARYWYTKNDAGSQSYRRANQDVMTSGNISRLYTIAEANPFTYSGREFRWQAAISGIASAGGGFTAMQNLILNRTMTEVTGVYPNANRDDDGDPILSADPGERSLIIVGTSFNPMRLVGQMVVRGDVVITGAYSGTGTIVSHRSFFIPNDLYYVNPPDYFDFSNLAGDQLGLIAAGNIMVGNILHNTTARTDLMEFVWGNMVDINSADITGATTWNYGRDGTASPAHNHMINPVYLFDGANAGYWDNGVWVVENEGNCVDERFNAQGMRIGGGLNASASNPAFNDSRKHVNFDGNSNPSTTNDNTSRYKNFWISTPGLLPEGASRISAMPTTYMGTYTGAWLSTADYKMFTVRPRQGTGNWTNTMAVNRTESSDNFLFIKTAEGVLYADYGVIGGNIAKSGPFFLEFRGAVIGRDIQVLSAIQNNTNGDNGALRPPQDFFNTHLVGGLYYDHRLRGSINPLGFPFTEKFLGGEMAHNYIPPVVNGSRDNWRPFRLKEEYKYLVQE